ncbi:MAG: SDR family NAD(P)-dependent oxidoreductase [Oscillospiraceae bacterium]
MENRVTGKIAFITGATSGIGRSCAYELAKLGANLILCARRTELLSDIGAKIGSEYGVKVLCLPLDVRSSKDVMEKLAALPKEWQDIDILVNNAGLAKGTEKVYENQIEDIDDMIDTNVKGLLYVIKAVVPQMVRRNAQGVVVNLGSVAGNEAYAGGAVYCGSKAAVRYISDGLRIDLMTTPIRVTTIEPGLVETEFSIVRFKGDVAKAKNVYTGIEALTPDDIAQTVAYVCNLPANVQIPEIILTPCHQADALNKHYEK